MPVEPAWITCSPPTAIPPALLPESAECSWRAQRVAVREVTRNGVSGATHAPAAQVRPAAHALPQVPQFAASDCTSTQAPPQRVRPVAHAVWHRPITQLAVPPPGATHALPHAPQCCALAISTVSQPLPRSRSQSPKPAKHWSPQTRPVHEGTPFVPPAQTFSHAPQFATLVARSTQSATQ